VKEKQVSPLRSPEFLSRLVALASFMRSSLKKTAHVDLSDVAKQEFGYALSKITSKKEHPHRDPSTALPRIPVEVGGAGKLYAAFLNESRTRGSV
jgi:hypothetical protein